MGSYQLLSSHSDQQQQQQVHNCSSSSSSLCTETQRGCSKAQNCLLKILRIISTVPPQNNTSITPQNSEKINGCNGFNIDLNIGFNLPMEMETGESGSPVYDGWVSGGQSSSSSAAAGGNFADEKSFVAAECGGVLTVDVGKCSDDDGECGKVETEKSFQSTENQEIIEIFKLENNGVSEKSESKEEIGELKKQQGFMGLLIEAATLIFGDFQDDNPKSESETDTKSFKSDSNREKLQMDELDGGGDDVAATKKQLKRRNNECTEKATMEDKSSYPFVRSKGEGFKFYPTNTGTQFSSH